MKENSNRVWELDFLRGIAVIMMIAFHIVFDLADFYGFDISYYRGFWYYEGRFAAILFMLISGVSATFSKSSFKRGLVVFGSAMLVTLVTIPVFGEQYIRFGILHFFGIAMIGKGIPDKIISSEKIKKWIYIIFVPVSLIIGNAVQYVTTDVPFLFPIGIVTRDFTSSDYYPIFPWISFFVIGILIGMIVYKDKQSKFPLTSFANKANNKVFKALGFLIKKKVSIISFVGKHSLVIYLLHQPVIMLLLKVIFLLIGES